METGTITVVTVIMILLMYKVCRPLRIQTRKGISWLLNLPQLPDVGIKTLVKKVLYRSCLLSSPWTLELCEFDTWYEREIRCNAVDFEKHCNKAVESLIKTLRNHSRLNIKEVIQVINRVSFFGNILIPISMCASMCTAYAVYNKQYK